MRKHGIILSVYSIIAALYIALSLILTTDRDTVFWIGFAMVLFAVGLTAVITVVTNQKRSSAFPLEISMVAFSAIYIAVVVAIGDERDHYRASCLNALHSKAVIESSLQIQRDEREYGLRVVCAMYHLEDGRVEFI